MLGLKKIPVVNDIWQHAIYKPFLAFHCSKTASMGNKFDLIFLAVVSLRPLIWEGYIVIFITLIRNTICQNKVCCKSVITSPCVVKWGLNGTFSRGGRCSLPSSSSPYKRILVTNWCYLFAKQPVGVKFMNAMKMNYFNTKWVVSCFSALFSVFWSDDC